MTICQWYTAENTEVDYRIGPQETKLETYSWTVPKNFPNGPVTITATLYYGLVPSSVAELMALPAYASKPRLVNSTSMVLEVKQ